MMIPVPMRFFNEPQPEEMLSFEPNPVGASARAADAEIEGTTGDQPKGDIRQFAGRQYGYYGRPWGRPSPYYGGFGYGYRPYGSRPWGRPYGYGR